MSGCPSPATPNGHCTSVDLHGLGPGLQPHLASTIAIVTVAQTARINLFNLSLPRRLHRAETQDDDSQTRCSAAPALFASRTEHEACNGAADAAWQAESSPNYRVSCVSKPFP